MRIDELPRSKKIEDRRAVRMRAGGIGIGTLVILATTASLTSIGRQSHKRLSTRCHGKRMFGREMPVPRMTAWLPRHSRIIVTDSG